MTPGKEPALRWGDIPVLAPRAVLPPEPQEAQDIGRQHHVAVLAPFCLDDADDVLGAVDIADLEPHHLAGAQATAVGQRQHGPQLDVRRHRQQAPDLVLAHHHRDLLRFLQVIDLGRQIVAPQRHPEQKPHAGHDPVAVTNAGPALDQEELEAADVVGRCRLRRAFEEGGKAFAAREVAALGMAAEFACRHVLDHALTQRPGGPIALDVHRKLLVSVEAKSPRPTRQPPLSANASGAQNQRPSAMPEKYRGAI
jgi:hypothetical protein